MRITRISFTVKGQGHIYKNCNTSRVQRNKWAHQVTLILISSF